MFEVGLISFAVFKKGGFVTESSSALESLKVLSLLVPKSESLVRVVVGSIYRQNSKDEGSRSLLKERYLG